MNYHWNIATNTRKYHYWRGFRAGLIVAVVVSTLIFVIQ